MMRAEVLDEPELEVGGGRHIDPRFGLAAYGPADLTTGGAPSAISIGLVDPAEQLDGLRRWLERTANARSEPCAASYSTGS